MEKRFYKELWNIRFSKMLELEKQSVVTYRSLLEECKKKHRGHSIESHLERLIKDETKHTSMVEELIHILNAQQE